MSGYHLKAITKRRLEFGTLGCTCKSGVIPRFIEALLLYLWLYWWLSFLYMGEDLAPWKNDYIFTLGHKKQRSGHRKWAMNHIVLCSFVGYGWSSCIWPHFWGVKEACFPIAESTPCVGLPPWYPPDPSHPLLPAIAKPPSFHQLSSRTTSFHPTTWHKPLMNHRKMTTFPLQNR